MGASGLTSCHIFARKLQFLEIVFDIAKRCHFHPIFSIDEMDQCLIEKWNGKVTNADTVYILGDLMFRNGKPPEEYLRQLRGKNIWISRARRKSESQGASASTCGESVISRKS